MAIACVSEEVLAEQCGPLSKKDKRKNNNGGSNSNGKPTPAQNNQNYPNKKIVDSMRNMNEDEKTNTMCPHCIKYHTGQCLNGSNKCFTCGKAGKSR